VAGTGSTVAKKRSRLPEEDATAKPKLNADAVPYGAIATDEKDPDLAELSRGGSARRAASSGDDSVDVEDLDRLESIEDIDELDDLDESEDDLDDEDALSDTLGDEDALDDDNLDADADADADGIVPMVAAGTAGKVAAPADASPEAETDDDELLTDEVEASLDVILAERLRGGETEADDEVELDDEEDDAPNQLATVIPVRRPEEFLCQSCFLLKPPGQLADRDHQLCRDCA
jgi:Domain of unknown function (DUF4193)